MYHPGIVKNTTCSEFLSKYIKSCTFQRFLRVYTCYCRCVLSLLLQVCFVLKHNYRSTAAALPSESQEQQVVWIEHRIALNLGQVSKPVK